MQLCAIRSISISCCPFTTAATTCILLPQVTRRWAKPFRLICSRGETRVLEGRDSELHRENFHSACRKGLHRFFRYSVVGNQKIDFAGEANNRRTYEAHLA